MAGSHPLLGLEDAWEDVIADMEATAEEYREAGWETLECHPGDVTPLPNRESTAEPDRLGLDVLLPGDEFRELEDLVADGEFSQYDAYRAAESDTVFLVIAMKAPDAGVAVLFPLYYSITQALPMLRGVAERAEMRTYLRPLDDSRRVVFSQEEPERLLPEGFEPDGDQVEE